MNSDQHWTLCTTFTTKSYNHDFLKTNCRGRFEPFFIVRKHGRWFGILGWKDEFLGRLAWRVDIGLRCRSLPKRRFQLLPSEGGASTPPKIQSFFGCGCLQDIGRNRMATKVGQRFFSGCIQETRNRRIGYHWLGLLLVRWHLWFSFVQKKTSHRDTRGFGWLLDRDLVLGYLWWCIQSTTSRRVDFFGCCE